jgi:hypothetical protein
MTNAEKVAEIGEALYGDHWPTPLARFAGVNTRTLQRIAAAARLGSEHQAADGVLAAMREELAIAIDMADS